MTAARFLGATGVLLVLLARPLPIAFADEEPPVDFITVNPDGTLAFDPSRLTPSGTIVMPPPQSWALGAYMGEVPGIDLAVCLGCMTFNTYATPSGQTVVVPTAYTAIVMAMTGESPFEARPEIAIMNTTLGLAAYARAFEDMGIDADDVADLDRWRLDPLFWLRLNVSLNDPRSPLNQASYFWASGLFVFACNPVTAECDEDIPGVPPALTEADDIGEAQAPNGTSACPLDLTISAPAPVIRAERLAPDFPVVVGQDPERRGADLSVDVTVPPVVVSYNVEVSQPERRCDWVGPGGGTGCPQGSYDNTDWHPWMAGNDWRAVDGTRVTCERRTETHPDRIASLRVQAELTAESIAWITGDLAARYPGARVYQPLWSLYPGLAPTSASLSPEGAVWSATWERVPFRDPGNYRVSVEGQTGGTPYTAPRRLDFREITFGVDLVMVALTK